jgi:uncharacterized protein involved in exopolysaccharide biosynthesis
VTTTNDHSSKIKLYGLVGLFAGIVVGCIVAVLREQRRTSRREIAVEMEAQTQGPSLA